MNDRGVPRGRIHQETLGNGLEVILAPRPASPTASVWVWYRVGSKNESPGITGASHWVEHMLFLGSPKYPKGSIDRAILRVGGELNAFTSTDFTAYFSTVPREHLTIPLDIEADRMTRAQISDVEVDRERTVIHSEREGNDNWPEFRVEEELYQLGFRHHPYQWDPLGRKSDIERLTAGELRDYYHRFYGTRNAVLVVAGGFDLPVMRRDVVRRFSRLPTSGADPTVTAVEPPARGERRSELSGPGTTPYVEIGWSAPAAADPAAPATLLLASVLGGGSAFFDAGGWSRAPEHPSSRLYRALVDPGLAVRAVCEWRPRVHPGLFSVQVQAAPGAGLDRIEQTVEDVVDRLARTGPTSEEIDLARVKIRRGAAIAYEGAAHTAFRLGYFAALGSVKFEDRIYRALLRVSGTELRDQARELFRDERRVTVRYVPAGGTRAG